MTLKPIAKRSGGGRQTQELERAQMLPKHIRQAQEVVHRIVEDDPQFAFAGYLRGNTYFKGFREFQCAARSLAGLCCMLLLCGAVRAEPIITTFAGGGDNGDGASALQASLNFPTGVALDKLGNVYFTDETTHRVRKVNRATGIITSIAGIGTSGFSGDNGPATAARLNLPIGLVVDKDFNIFVCEKANHRVRRIDGVTGIITTVAGTGDGTYNGDNIPATQASLRVPVEVTVDQAGNLYIVDQGNHRIRKISPLTGIITTVAGNGDEGYSGDGGLATEARLKSPAGIVVSVGGDIFIADKSNHRVRRVVAATGVIRTIAGNGGQGDSGDGGLAKNATFDRPANVELTPLGDLLIVDEGSNRIRRVDRNTGIITSVVGDGKFEFNGDGIPANQAGIILPTGFSSPGLAVAWSGNMVFADRGNQRVRMVTAQTGLISTIAGGGDIGNGGPATAANTVVPSVVAFDADGAVIVCDRGNNQIRRVDPVTGIITPYVGTGMAGFSGDGGPAVNARVTMPLYIAFDRHFNLYISDQFNQVIRRVDAATKIITTVVGMPGVAGGGGDGFLATQAKLQFPMGLAFDSDDNFYIADQYNARVRRVDSVTGIITTVVGTGARGYSGDGGLATAATIGLPVGLAFDSQDNLYVSDREHSVVRKVDKVTGKISRYAGTVVLPHGGIPGYSGDGGPAKSARMRLSHGINFDPDDNLYIADFGNGAIRRVDAVTKIITTVAGTGEPGFSGDGGSATHGQLNLPMSVIVDGAGDLYIGDVPNNRIRKVIMNP